MGDGKAFLIAGYVLTWLTLLGYGVSLYFRMRKYEK